MVSLVLFNCDFKAIDPRYFDGMMYLRVLHISSRQLTLVNPANITWTVNLDEMRLGLYKCIKIHEYTFRGLHNLIRLSLNHDSQSLCYYRIFLVINQAKLRDFYFESSTVQRPTLALNTTNLKNFIIGMWVTTTSCLISMLGRYYRPHNL